MGRIKRVVLLLTGIAVFVFPQAGIAEYFSYTDENGVQRYTDDLSSVPEHLIEKADKHKSVGSESRKNQTAEGLRLENIKQNLDKEYEGILKEKQAIADLKKKSADGEENISLEARINIFNQKSQNYNDRVDEYNEQLEAYESNK